MLKTSTIAACVLALSGSVALAQTYPAQQGSTQGSTTAPGTTSGQTTNGMSSQGYGMQGQGMQGQGMRDPGLQDTDTQSQAQLPSQTDNARGVAITDEYGNQYNSRGDRIGRGRPAAQQQMR